MLLLLWSPFKLQLNEGSFTSDKNWHPANTISQQICHKTLKYCQGQINVCDNSQNNLALHNRYNVMWHRKQPSLSKHRCLEAVCGSSILSRALASTRLTSKGQDRLHQEDAKRTLTGKEKCPLEKHCSIPYHFQVQTPIPTGHTSTLANGMALMHGWKNLASRR
jgi:hypothetical protein